MAQLRIGTCSWKYPSWQGLVYSAAKGINFLEEYAQWYQTVEIDHLNMEKMKIQSDFQLYPVIALGIGTNTTKIRWNPNTG